MDVDVERLPHRARVAFAARCARLALPLFDECWPLAGPVYRGHVLEAIRAAELSARSGCPVDGTRAAWMDAGQSAGRPLVPFLCPDMPDDEDEPDRADGDPPDRDVAAIASLAANVASHAAKAADAPPPRAVREANEAWGFLVGAAHQYGRRYILDRAADEFSFLRRQAKRERWTDATPIPGAVFARLEDDAPD